MKRLFFIAFFTTFMIKTFTAYLIPLTGDEAYVWIWAKKPSFGYYDHPPMLGWLLYLITKIGDSVVLLRLPAIISPLLIALIMLFLKRDYLPSSLYLLSPLNLLYFIITTDTPLLLFSFLSGIFFFKGEEERDLRYFIISGIFLGLALLSKYLAFLLLLSFLIFCLIRRIFKGFLLMLLFSFLLFLENIIFNYNHCWVNLMFNLINRNREIFFSFKNPFYYVVFQLIILSPPIIILILNKGLKANKNLFLFIIPLSIMFILSFFREVGLHWTVSFYPFLFLSLSNIKRKDLIWTFLFSFLPILLIWVILVIPHSYFKDFKFYKDIIFYTQQPKLLKEIEKYKGYVLATTSYSKSAIMSYYSKSYFLVWGIGSEHGREDDILTDFRTLEGKSFLIFNKDKPNLDEFQRYFAQVKLEPINVSGVCFYVVRGDNFSYENYKGILSSIKDRFYNIPPFLPKGRCYFCEKYK